MGLVGKNWPLLVLIIASAATAQNQDPDTILRNAVELLSGGLRVIFTGCPDPNPYTVHFLTYTREKANDALNLTFAEKEIALRPRPTKVFIHGWTGNGTASTTIDMKDAYLKKGDYNFISVDWSQHAGINYAEALCNIPKVGKIIADFLIKLADSGAIKWRDVHLIGHSIGAHLAGAIGQQIGQTTRQRVGRITGLDAAGPGFVGLPEQQRLDRADADFVDAIHTNGGQFGYAENYAHADFYPNCGTVQSGCLEFNFTLDTPIPVSIDRAMENLFCSHNRVVDFWTESINSNKFVVVQCPGCFFRFLCSSKVAVMGEDCPTTARSQYYLDTNKQAPYGKGSVFSLV